MWEVFDANNADETIIAVCYCEADAYDIVRVMNTPDAGDFRHRPVRNMALKSQHDAVAWGRRE